MKTHFLGYRILSLFAFLLASNCVEAQVTLAYCRIDGGCKFYQTALTYKEVDAMMNYMGVFEEKKGIAVFFKNKQGEEVYYGDYKRSPKELNEYFGGKGEPSIAKGGVLKPFDNTIQPKDGNWTITASKPVLKNCPAGLEKQMDNLVLPKSGNKVFKKPFDGTEILPAGTKWLTLSPNVYRGLILTETQPTFKSIYDVKVINPSQMEGTLNVILQIPSQKTCEVKIDFSYKN